MAASARAVVSETGSPAMARVAPMLRVGWIESFNGHLKGEYPYLLAIEDPATLRAELADIRGRWNSVRLHEGIGYVTPNDEHEGRGDQIRKARQAGLEQARQRRLARHRQNRHTQPTQDPDDVG